jgi:hypothetical protein
MSPPDSALANLQQPSTNLERQLSGQRPERDEALVWQTATAELLRIMDGETG